MKRAPVPPVPHGCGMPDCILTVRSTASATERRDCLMGTVCGEVLTGTPDQYLAVRTYEASLAGAKLRERRAQKGTLLREAAPAVAAPPAPVVAAPANLRQLEMFPDFAAAPAPPPTPPAPPPAPPSVEQLLGKLATATPALRALARKLGEHLLPGSDRSWLHVYAAAAHVEGVQLREMLSRGRQLPRARARWRAWFELARLTGRSANEISGIVGYGYNAISDGIHAHAQRLDEDKLRAIDRGEDVPAVAPPAPPSRVRSTG